jgi:hypothetical protein
VLTASISRGITLMMEAVSTSETLVYFHIYMSQYPRKLSSSNICFNLHVLLYIMEIKNVTYSLLFAMVFTSLGMQIDKIFQNGCVPDARVI